MTDCGDGKITAGEECDDGVAKNKGGYNECRPDCTLGPALRRRGEAGPVSRGVRRREE